MSKLFVWLNGKSSCCAQHLMYSSSGKIRGLAYSIHSRKLISAAEDNLIGVWDMDSEREEVMRVVVD